MISEREAALLAKIEATFSGVPHPGDDGLTDSVGEGPAALTEQFRGRTDWRDLSADFLDRACDGSALAFFSDAALQFYLPAYLMADVHGALSLASPEVRLTWSLTAQSEPQRLAKAWGGGTMGERARRCFDRFNRGQVSAVVDYLKWKLDCVGDDPCISEALERYWLPRLESP